MAGPVLSIENLFVDLPGGADRKHAVGGLTLSVNPGEIVCVVGESGSGKSVTAQAVMGLLPKGQLTRSGGRIVLEGEDISHVSMDRLRDLRGTRMAMIFQEPMTALNPLHTVGRQIGEMFRIHTSFGVDVIEQRVHTLLDEVRMPDPQAAAGACPREPRGRFPRCAQCSQKASAVARWPTEASLSSTRRPRTCTPTQRRQSRRAACRPWSAAFPRGAS
jgi:peptide/nickel transport system ATP-binding protein